MQCPYCAEEIQDAAIKCRFCNEWISQSGPAKSINAKELTAAAASGAKTAFTALFGTTNLGAPTDSVPIEITKDLQLAQSYFVWRGAKIPYSEIHRVECESKSGSINGIPAESVATLTFICDSIPSPIKAWGMGYIVTGKTTKRIRFATAYISKVTFQSRMQRYWNLFNQTGTVVLEDVDGENVTLDREGFVIQTHNRFTFSDVREKGGIDTGVSERNWQGSGHSQPTRTWIVDDLEVSQFRLGTVGRTKARTLTPRKWIDFTPKYDADVCVSLLHHLLGKHK